MNSITKETRRESYDAILPKVKKRSRLILIPGRRQHADRLHLG